jgi:hypothetical protein
MVVLIVYFSDDGPFTSGWGAFSGVLMLGGLYLLFTRPGSLWFKCHARTKETLVKQISNRRIKRAP